MLPSVVIGHDKAQKVTENLSDFVIFGGIWWFLRVRFLGNVGFWAKNVDLGVKIGHLVFSDSGEKLT